MALREKRPATVGGRYKGKDAGTARGVPGRKEGEERSFGRRSPSG